MLMDEPTIPECPALIIPPGHDTRPRRWRAVWQRAPHDYKHRDGVTAEAASLALLTAVADAELRDGAVEILDLIELPEREDDRPQRRYYRCARGAGDAWTFTLLEVC